MAEAKILWEPGDEFLNQSNLPTFIQWLRDKGINKNTYPELHHWSVKNIENFWSCLLEYFDVQYTGNISQLLQVKMPKAKWWDGISLS
jgi:acetoacetyl-CoA synthetase